VRVMNGKVEMVPVWCKRWKCPACAERMMLKWAARVSLAKPERLVTFTRIGETSKDVTRGLRQLVQWIRRRGYAWEYWGVIEPHASGAPHMHLLQRGDYIDKDVLQEGCGKVGWGWSDIRVVGKSFAAGRYCAKHLASMHQGTVFKRCIRYSRGFFPKDEADGDGPAEGAGKWEVVRQRP
jgi:hypothetical protein